LVTWFVHLVKIDFENCRNARTLGIAMDSQCVAELSGVSKRFGKIVALDELSLAVRNGELFALLGPNGAGKTTAISLFLGLYQPDGGSATLFGCSPQSIDVRRRIGVMMQEAALAPELRVREQIDLVASYYPDPLSPEAAMELTGIAELGRRPYAKLSGGQKRQTQFAMALVGRPSLLFLDEPTAGLDVQAREIVWTTIRRLVADGCSVVLTTHYLEEAEALADRVAVIARGRLIASGTVDDMRALVVRKRIACRTSLTPEQVRCWPDVQTATTDGQSLRITTTNAENVVRRLLAADDDLQDLEIERARLAEAFTELTQEVTQ
jgi:ABC-2 type transport system ATP-binding protein